MRTASTRLLEQGTQTPSPAPDLIPADAKQQLRTNIEIGTANGGTSGGWGSILLRELTGSSENRALSAQGSCQLV